VANGFLAECRHQVADEAARSPRRSDSGGVTSQRPENDVLRYQVLQEGPHFDQRGRK
jgi:hypothetical protein